MTAPAHLLNNRCDPEARAVLGDWLEERGRRHELMALGVAFDDAADVDDADDTADDDAADDADAAGDYAADDADDADAADPDDARLNAVNRYIRGESTVTPGLAIVSTPGSYYYPLQQVGWLRRAPEGGDEWELVNARVIVRTGERKGMSWLMRNGPRAGHYTLREMSSMPQPIHRLAMRRVEMAHPDDVAKWLDEVPRPTDWSER